MMKGTPLKNLVTIVIPSKNEGTNLYTTVSYISLQHRIAGVKVIIADCSHDEQSLKIVKKVKSHFKYSLNVEVIPGGYPAYGRYHGAKLVETPYVLFLDADVFLYNKNVIYDVVKNTKHLSTVTFSTDKGYNWIYKVFTFSQRVMKLFGSSFAIGGFQLFKTEAYRYAGEYNPDQVFAEDYYISNKIQSSLFSIHNIDGVYTSARRFKNKGLFYMLSLMLKCWVNRNNPNFYLKSHGYWN
jgi:glycosyltransferase involved in cell wall biosynthesis